VSGPTETFRGVVRAEQCDHFGHMNVQFYDAALSDAFLHMLSLIGLGPAVVKQRRLGLAAVSMELKFRRELRPGDLYMVETGFLEVTERQVHTAHRMTRLTDGVLALNAHSLGFPFDLEARKRTTMPDDILAAARTFVAPKEVFGL
jgi:acyl-CoA thioester hydrolase